MMFMTDFGRVKELTAKDSVFKTEIKIISKLFQDPENGGSSLKKKKKKVLIF